MYVFGRKQKYTDYNKININSENFKGAILLLGRLHSFYPPLVAGM